MNEGGTSLHQAGVIELPLLASSKCCRSLPLRSSGALTRIANSMGWIGAHVAASSLRIDLASIPYDDRRHCRFGTSLNLVEILRFAVALDKSLSGT